MHNFVENNFKAVFCRHRDSFSKLLYSQSNFPCERHFLAPGGSKGQKKGERVGSQNSSFPEKWHLEVGNLLRYIVLHQIFNCGIYFYRTTFFNPFWETLLVKWEVQKLPISPKIPPEVSNLHIKITFHEKNDTVTHSRQITNFDSFSGTL